jgi:glycosyltransferase 2 family protein
VALLVVVAGLVGVDEAVAALHVGYKVGSPAQARLAALLQPLALPHRLRRTVRGTTLLGDLRKALVGEATTGGVSTPPRLVRLRARTVITVAGGTLAAHILASQLSSVGIGSALRSASFGWLAVALLGSAVTYLGAALATKAFVPTDLPLGRTTLVQLASSFLALVTPPAVGHVGLTVRYLQREGVPLALATVSVAVKEVFTVVVTVAGLIVCAWLTGVSAARLSLLPSGAVLAVLGVAAVGIAVVAILPPTRRLLLRRLQPLLRRTIPQLVAAISQPRRVAAGLAGVLLLNAGNVLALDASLRAFSTTLAVPALVVVFLAASALGSAAPTPGGLGAVEAALVGGLTATGVAVAPAITAVLAFRAVTFWLPAPLGWLAFVGLQRRGRL